MMESPGRLTSMRFADMGANACQYILMYSSSSSFLRGSTVRFMVDRGSLVTQLLRRLLKASHDFDMRTMFLPWCRFTPEESTRWPSHQLSYRFHDSAEG